MASNELTVAYPGREGAHSAAACDRLFPAARLVPLPTFSDVVDAVASGRVPVRRAADRELARRAGRTRPTTSSTNRRSRSWPRRSCRSTTASSARPRSRSRTCARSTRTRWRSTSAAGCSPRCPARRAVAAPTTGDAASTVAELGDPTVVAIASDRAARINGLTIIDDNVGDHPEAYTRFVSVAPYTRLDRRDGPVANGVLVHDRPPARRAAPRARAARPPRASTSTCSCRGRSRRGPFSYRFDAVLGGHPLDAEIASTLQRDARPDRAAARVRLLPRRPARAASWRAAA